MAIGTHELRSLTSRLLRIGQDHKISETFVLRLVKGLKIVFVSHRHHYRLGL